MAIVQLPTRAKQALIIFILLAAIVLTHFATKAWAMGEEAGARKTTAAQPSSYQRRFAPEDFISSTTTSTTTTTTTAPPVATKQKAVSIEAPAVKQATGDIWEALRNCEAGGNYSRNSGNGYYGAYQFSASTWRSMNTGYEYAHLAPPEVQDDAARRLQARSGWGQWPACSKKIGVR
jgi:hypothetical protein